MIHWSVPVKEAYGCHTPTATSWGLPPLDPGWQDENGEFSESNLDPLLAWCWHRTGWGYRTPADRTNLLDFVISMLVMSYTVKLKWWYLLVHLAISRGKRRQSRESKFNQKLPHLKPLRGSGVRRAPQILLFFLKAPLSKAFVKTREERNKFIRWQNGRLAFSRASASEKTKIRNVRTRRVSSRSQAERG